jgi:signal transduction histidine kinase
VRTGSLRSRVTLTIVIALVVVLAGVIAVVTVTYRASRERDLADQLRAAGDVFGNTPAGPATKLLIANLAREGIAVEFGARQAASPDPQPAQAGDPRAASSGGVTAAGSLVSLDQILPDGTRVTLSASRDEIDRSVGQLLTIELAAAAAAVVLAALLIRWVTGTALRPLDEVSRAAGRIAGGQTSLRLRPTRPDTELGSMAVAFDDMVDALDAAVKQARDAEEAMSRFVSDASHELRTPIAALQATAETLLREQPRRPRRDALEARLAGDGARLGRLVDDLLSLARLDAEASMRFTPVNLCDVAEAGVAAARARSAGSLIELDGSPGSTVNGDPESLSRVVRNLLDNALTAAGPTGHVRVRVMAGPDEARFTIEDDGPGVPAVEHERIFERFVRLDPSAPTGNGLGLAIALRIARQHGGDITCDTVPAGAQFTLRLPLASSTLNQAGSARPAYS